jgi:hypothetical protein
MPLLPLAFYSLTIINIIPDIEYIHNIIKAIIMLKYCLLLSLGFIYTLSPGQYKLMGDADYMAGDCIQLTPDVAYSEGIAYNYTKLDLSMPFQIEFDIYLGNKNEYGADGITFVIHNDPKGFEAFGTYGECMGYGRWRKNYVAGNFIAPSIAIEFDTYQNETQNDPICDHVAYLENGTNYHMEYWNDNKEDFNLENDMMHTFQFGWNPLKQTILVRLDGKIVYSGKRDLIKDIFSGETKVIWGFTASTGNKFNQQYFCLKKFASR